MYGCRDLTELDLLDNPNEVTAETVDPNLLYNQIQLSFVDFYHAMHDVTDGVMRMTGLDAFSYEAALPPTVGNRAWRIAYAELLPDIALLESLNSEGRLDVHAGSARILQSYVLSTLVDYFGDVPLGTAGQGTDLISPGPTPGRDVYAYSEALLDEAIVLLTHAVGVTPSLDQFYEGDRDKWITLAKSLKFRLYHNTRLVDPAVRDKMEALLAEGDLIDDPAEDFVFHWSSNRSNPDARHPAYREMYESAINTYLGHYFMWLLCCEKEVDDPRRRFYFYRQIRNTYEQDPNTSSCPFDVTETPDHFVEVDPRLPFCIMSYGYFGRDHGNGQGIPPDQDLRTVYGLYPAGGRWDNQSFRSTLNLGTNGARGAGISPILTSAFVHFMRAEAALTLGTSDDAAEQLELAVTASIEKVCGTQTMIPPHDLDFYVITSASTGYFARILLPDMEEIQEYLDAVMGQFQTAPLETTMKEFYVALWGNSIEAYNMYRRTGMPSNMQPGLDPFVIGAFPRSLLYPTDHVTLNASVRQKSLDDLVFWDDGSANVR